MMTFLYVLVWFSLFLILYNYLLFPLLVYLISKIHHTPHDCYAPDDEWPSVCLIIPAVGDPKIIKKKIENTLRLYYPENKLMLLAVSDKNDETVQAMLADYKKHRIINFSKRGIDSHYQALDIGAKLAKSDIVVLSDVKNEFNDLVLMKLARHFKDPSIGAVSGIRSLYSSASNQQAFGDNLYWKYETFIKNAESRIGSITAAAGEILAIRKSLYHPVARDYINFDSAITFDLVKQGYRVVLDDEAISLMSSSRDMKNSFSERLVMAKGGFQTFFREWRQLIPPRSWFAFAYLSHKALRLLIPFLLLILFCVPFWLLNSPIMLIFLVLQVFFYLFAVFGWLLRKKYKLPVYVNFASWYGVMNVAVLAGFFKFLFRR